MDANSTSTDRLPVVHGVCWIVMDHSHVAVEQCPKKAKRLGFDGAWFIPGGKIEEGECADETLERELREEWPGFRHVEAFPLPLVQGSSMHGQDLFLMRPYLIIGWDGEVPEISGDDDIPIRFAAVSECMASPVPQVRMMVAAATHRLEQLWMEEEETRLRQMREHNNRQQAGACYVDPDGVCISVYSCDHGPGPWPLIRLEEWPALVGYRKIGPNHMPAHEAVFVCTGDCGREFRFNRIDERQLKMVLQMRQHPGDLPWFEEMQSLLSTDMCLACAAAGRLPAPPLGEVRKLETTIIDETPGMDVDAFFADARKLRKQLEDSGVVGNYKSRPGPFEPEQ